MTPLSTKTPDSDVDAKIASPTLTHIISKKRSRLTSTTSCVDFVTTSGDNVVNDEENNVDEAEVKCLASPGSKSKSCNIC
jgi:hypothetical protein